MLTMGNVGGGWPTYEYVFLQRNSFWKTNDILDGSSENGGKMFGKHLDCSSGWDNSSTMTPYILGVAVIEAE